MLIYIYLEQLNSNYASDLVYYIGDFVYSIGRVYDSDSQGSYVVAWFSGEFNVGNRFVFLIK